MTDDEKGKMLQDIMEKFVEFKKQALELKLKNWQMQTAMLNFDQGFLWLREAIFTDEHYEKYNH